MSWDINHVVIVGRLTRDPELTYTQSGKAICRFSIAVNRSSGKDTDDSANFFNIVTWNKTAEICNEYLSKGRQVGIDGRLQQRRWEAQDGSKRSIVEIVANNVQFFGSPREGGGFTGSRDSGSREMNGRGPGAGYRSGGRSGGFDESQGMQNRQSGSGGSDQHAGESDGDPFLSELDDDEIPF